MKCYEMVHLFVPSHTVTFLKAVNSHLEHVLYWYPFGLTSSWMLNRWWHVFCFRCNAIALSFSSWMTFSKNWLRKSSISLRIIRLSDKHLYYLDPFNTISSSIASFICCSLSTSKIPGFSQIVFQLILSWCFFSKCIAFGFLHIILVTKTIIYQCIFL